MLGYIRQPRKGIYNENHIMQRKTRSQRKVPQSHLLGAFAYFN